MNNTQQAHRRSHTHPGSEPVAGLIADLPIQRLLEKFASDRDRFRAYSADSDWTRLMTLVTSELDQALRSAREHDMYLSVLEVVKESGIPHSTVNYWCRRYGAECGAFKIRNKWVIEWPRFNRFLKNHLKPKSSE